VEDLEENVYSLFVAVMNPGIPKSNGLKTIETSRSAHNRALRGAPNRPLEIRTEQDPTCKRFAVHLQVRGGKSIIYFEI
jgi:hypothetical protein